MNQVDWVLFLGVLALAIATTIPLCKRLGASRAWLLLPVWLLVADRCSSIYKPSLGRGPAFLGLVKAFCSPDMLPLYLVALASLVLVAECWRAERVARRKAACQCSGCGYDLTANTSGICPECGSKAK